jgi:hypothetical protein
MRFAPNKVLIFIVVFFLSVASHAAPGDPPPPTPPTPVGLPLDSGIFLLYIGATIFGIYKLYQFNNNKKASN